MGIFSRIGGIITPASSPAQPRREPVIGNGGGLVVADTARPKHRAGLQGGWQGFAYPYDAASVATQDMGDWLPVVKGPDAETNLYRDRMVARSRDLVRNDGWAGGGIDRMLDALLGGTYRLTCTPDYISLAREFGPGFDAEWANEYRKTVESLWRAYSESNGHWNDVHRSLTTTQQFRQALWHYLVDGEALGVHLWLPEDIGRGRAKFATSLQIIDPDRLSNPYQQVDHQFLRGGIELDERRGAPQAYWMRKGEPNSFYDMSDSYIWERVEREDDDGWQRVLHHTVRNRADTHRGVGVFTPVMGRMKMLSKYYGVELQAATVASMFGLFIKSPFDPALAEDELSPGGDGLGLGGLGAYQEYRSAFHEERRPQMHGVAIPTLAAGESLETVSAERPNAGFGPFAAEMLRNTASALNIPFEGLTQDFSKVNYSSVRAAFAQTEKTARRRVTEFNTSFANKHYSVWLQEVHERGLVPLPAGAPDYVEAREYYGRCGWRGPGAGVIDGVKERQAEVLGMEAGIRTLRDVCADENGSDWQENVEQRAVELRFFAERNMVPPDWGGTAPPDAKKGPTDLQEDEKPD